ncbi:maltose regulon regulatory protein MalI [Klebsiella pneumoniae]|nr:maltose regulon regulatory protein MalI [Klebsiella pneumoniae]
MAIAKKITINDVALAAGVSVSTVSLVLSGKGRISSATGGRVNQAIEQLGFVRNRQAASLRGGQSGVIGLIVSDLSKPFYAELTAGLTDALERQGKMVFLTQGGRSGEKMAQRFDTLAAQLVTEHLIRRGHQRIAWLGGQSASLTRAERVGGYCATLLKYGLPFHSEWVLECESSQKQAAEAMTGLLRQNPTITAVLCYNNVVATGAWFGLLRAGRQSGEDGVESYFEQRVALAAFADVPEAALDDLPLTWVTTPAREMGKSLADSMLRRLEEGTGETRNQIMPPRLVTRK